MPEKVVTTIYIEKELKEFLEQQGNASEFISFILNEYKSTGNIKAASYLYKVESIEKKIKNLLDEMQNNVWKKDILDKMRQLEKKDAENISKINDLLKELQTLKEEIHNDAEAFEKAEKVRQEEQKSKEMLMHEIEKRLIKKMEFQAGILIKYYNEKTGRIEMGDDVKVSLDEYLMNKLENLVKEYSEAGIQATICDLIDYMGNIEVNGKKLNDFAWWREWASKR